MTNTMTEAFEAAREISGHLDKLDAEKRKIVLRWLCDAYGLQAPPTPSSSLGLSAPSKNSAEIRSTTASTAGTTDRPPLDIKSFIQTKAPSSDNQFAATVAYYYRFEAPDGERKDAIESDDLQEACRLAGRARLGDPGKTLRNAKDQGYLDLADRGKFAINTVGENLVAMTLPSQSSGTKRQAGGKKKVGKKTAKKSSGKKK